MTSNSTWRRRACGLAAGIAVLAMASLGTSTVWAYSETVNSRCGDDYHTYCRQHALGSTELRYCFEANRNKLSQSCITALVDAGEVPRKYLSRENPK